MVSSATTKTTATLAALFVWCASLLLLVDHHTILLVLPVPTTVEAFRLTTTPITPLSRSRCSSRLCSSVRLRCICVDCQWVTSCKAYHFVETKHKQPHMSEEPTFLPAEGSPTIQVNIRTEPKRGVVGDGGDSDDTTVARLWKDQHKPQHEDAGEEEHNGSSAAPTQPLPPVVASGGTAIESVVVTNTTTTIEYDVVACADFVLEQGCWARNMPDEIRRVNPDFVPT